jgi:hypothetical protein
MRTAVPSRSASRPSARSLITRIACASVDRLDGGLPSTRRAESPRPIPQTVRLPKVSLRVANNDAVTDQSLVSGLVTIGPTVIADVAARIWA